MEPQPLRQSPSIAVLEQANELIVPRRAEHSTPLELDVRIDAECTLYAERRVWVLLIAVCSA